MAWGGVGVAWGGVGVGMGVARRGSGVGVAWEWRGSGVGWISGPLLKASFVISIITRAEKVS